MKDKAELLLHADVIPNGDCRIIYENMDQYHRYNQQIDMHVENISKEKKLNFKRILHILEEDREQSLISITEISSTGSSGNPGG